MPARPLRAGFFLPSVLLRHFLKKKTTEKKKQTSCKIGVRLPKSTDLT